MLEILQKYTQTVRDSFSIPFLFSWSHLTGTNSIHTTQLIIDGLIHDMASPLTALSFFITNTATQTREKEVAETSCSEVLSLLHELRTFNEKPTYTKQPLSVQHVIQTSCRLLSHHALRNNVRIVFYATESVTIYTHLFGLREAITNTLSNAIDAYIHHHSANRNEVIITLSTTKKYVYITIEDFGCGIPKEASQKIYKKGFSTKDQSRGHGLYNTKKLLSRLCNGKIHIESEYKAGTKVTITLPKNSPQSARPRTNYRYRKR